MQVGLGEMTIVVSGAASGVGAAVAGQAAASGAAGMLLTDRDAAGLARIAAEIGPVATTMVAELGDPGAPAAILAAALDRFDRIDGLVNAAAVTTRAGIGDATVEDWDAIMAINARAPFFLMQGAVRDMQARAAPGAIVNILSVNAHCGQPDLAVYSASKGALLTLTRNVANACLAQRIRVNGINLGWTLTASEHRMQAEVLGLGEGWLAAAAAGQPLGRLLDPGEAARLAVFLLSPASAPVTGVALDLDQHVLGGTI